MNHMCVCVCVRERERERERVDYDKAGSWPSAAGDLNPDGNPVPLPPLSPLVS